MTAHVPDRHEAPLAPEIFLVGLGDDADLRRGQEGPSTSATRRSAATIVGVICDDLRLVQAQHIGPEAAGHLFRHRIVARRQDPGVQVAFDLYDQVLVKIVEDSRRNAAPIVNRHGWIPDRGSLDAFRLCRAHPGIITEAKPTCRGGKTETSRLSSLVRCAGPPDGLSRSNPPSEFRIRRGPTETETVAQGVARVGPLRAARPAGLAPARAGPPPGHGQTGRPARGRPGQTRPGRLPPGHPAGQASADVDGSSVVRCWTFGRSGAGEHVRAFGAHGLPQCAATENGPDRYSDCMIGPVGGPRVPEAPHGLDHREHPKSIYSINLKILAKLERFRLTFRKMRRNIIEPPIPRPSRARWPTSHRVKNRARCTELHPHGQD